MLELVFCPNCRKEIQSDFNTCPYCSFQLNGPEPVWPSADTPPEPLVDTPADNVTVSVDEPQPGVII
ncbi:MAG: zinc-ribbon domain-containing protein [Eggerthellaceae bacterium]|nr:zinc-ribbon domain-containing protein [Eggerthellaceae bacterium]